MAGIVIAWLLGEGIVTYRWARAGAPPTPGALAAASGFFVLTAILAEYAPARSLATALAFGIDVAALLQVLPGGRAAQDTGWPPMPINDPSVFLPRGSGAGGDLLPEGAGLPSGPGTGAPGTPTSGGKCPPGFPPGVICAG